VIFCFEEYGKWMEITGYRKVAFAEAEGFLKANRKETGQAADVQFFDAELIATQQHLYFAALNALQAFQNKTNISKSPAMETMLYASAQRQIQKAIQRCGIKPQTTKMAVLIIGENPASLKFVLEAISKCVGAEPDESVLELSREKEKRIIEVFQITNEELKTLTQKEAVINLIIERVALLSTQL
jgi:tRNA threonylcarbamoyladenosine modification (KEOPS) complex Cgi121 subunit